MKVPIQDFKNTTIEESTKSYHTGPNFISWGEHLGYDRFDDIVLGQSSNIANFIIKLT